MSASRFRTQKMTTAQMLTMGANLLYKAFHDTNRVDAKRRYRALEEGKKVLLTELGTREGDRMLAVLSLDCSEMHAKLNFSMLRGLVGQLLNGFAQVLNTKQPLNSFSDEKRKRCVYLLPAILESEGTTDMLVLAIDLSEPGTFELALMFIDPEQFRQTAAAATA